MGDSLSIRPSPLDPAAQFASLATVMESSIDMNDLYGSSPPRSRAQRNALAITFPTPQRGTSTGPLIDFGETSQKLNERDKLIDFDDS
jgi:hypothetical protein